MWRPAAHSASVNWIGKCAAVALALLGAWQPARAQEPASKPARVVVIPVRDAIDKPVLYIIRRAVKQAIEEKADAVVLDMKTPGGSLGVTLEIMEALDRFPGKTITFVNDEATSAGAIIASVTDEIHFSPKATIGAAEAITGTGEDIGESLKRKLNSFMGAKIRSFAGEFPMRADVIKAMMEPAFEFKIGETIIKPKDELLSLTATEAMKAYGEPPRPLLGAGITESVEGVLKQAYPGRPYSIERIQVTWAEAVAQYLNALAPLLVALGVLGLIIEFKTPGFGVIGITGIVLLAIVMFGHHVAGLSGHEPLLLLVLGLALLAAELFLWPGTLVAGLSGAALIFVSLVWAMMDIWPDQPLSLESSDLLRPLANVTLGALGALALFLAMLKWLPGGGLWSRMVLESAVTAHTGGVRALHQDEADPTASQSLLGSTGTAATALRPSGQVLIGGKRYEARLQLGLAEAGARVRVIRVGEFELEVEALS